jgi:hypothetical protein
MVAFASALKLICCLLVKGVDCNARAIGNLIALYVAVFIGFQTIVKLLLASGVVAFDKC